MVSNVFFFNPGIGLGTYSVGAVISVQTSFDKYRGLAQGVIMASIGAATFVWPPVCELLLRNYGLFGTLLIFGGVHLHGCVFGAMLRPKKFVNKIDTETTVHDKDKQGQHASAEHIQLSKDGRSTDHMMENSPKQGYTTKQSTQVKSQSLLANRPFLILYVGLILGMFSTPLEYMYLPEVAVNRRSTLQQAAFLPSVFGKISLKILTDKILEKNFTTA